MGLYIKWLYVINYRYYIHRFPSLLGFIDIAKSEVFALVGFSYVVGSILGATEPRKGLDWIVK